MHFAYVCADRGVAPAGRDGSATHVRELVRALIARGHRVTMLAAQGRDAEHALGCSAVDLGADVVFSELRGAVAEHDAMSQTAREMRALLMNSAIVAALDGIRPAPDVVYERQSLWCWAALDWAKRRGIPHLLEVNAPLVDQQKEYRAIALTSVAEAIERILLSGSTRVLLTSEGLRGYAISRGSSARRVRVVPCGVAGKFLDEGATRSYPRDSRYFTVGFLGSLKPWHGIDIALRAFRKLHAIDRSFRFVIVGDGPMRGEIERYLRIHGLDIYSELTGEVAPEVVPSLLARMDAGVAPYPANESFYFSPLKIWEYAGAGVPIAASAIGDLPQHLPHREAALLHPPGSASRLAEHVQSLREDPQLAARLARRARRIAAAQSWDRIAARVESVAASAVGERPSGCHGT